MKIATLTLDEYNNQGNILQRYALCEVLKNYSCEVESIWFEDKMLLENNWKNSGIWLECNIKQLIKFFINKKNFAYNIIFGNNSKIIQRDTLIKSFCDRYIPIRYDANFNTIDYEYDYFVTGSDQVWNPFYELDYFKLMLRFASPHKRISYAASISVPEIPSKKIKEFEIGLMSMSHISVRERGGAKLIKQITGRDVNVVIDPTLLIEADKWREISYKPQWLNADEKYLLTYFLGSYPRKIINRVAKKQGLKVIDLFGLKNFDAYVVGPEEWMYLIDHAQLVYTDSFHGSVFSIIFKTPFIIIERQGDLNMNSRFDELLGMFNLLNRRASVKNNYEIKNPYNIDFSNVDLILEREKNKALKFLSDALNSH